MTIYYLPYRRFKFYLTRVAGLTRPHAERVVSLCNRLAIPAKGLDNVTEQDIIELGLGDEYLKALHYYQDYLKFIREAGRRKGQQINFKKLADEYKTSKNVVKRLFSEYVRIHKKRHLYDYLSTDGLSLYYILPPDETAEFKNYLEKAIKKNKDRYHTYSDFLANGGGTDGGR